MRAATLWILLCLIVGADSSRAQTPENPSYDFIIEGLVKDVRFEGAPDDAAQQLKDKLALSGQRRLLFRRSPRYQNSLLHEDLERIRLYLARHGYPWADIRPELTPRETPGELDLIFHIDPGPAVRITRSELVGWPKSVRRPSKNLLPPLTGSILMDPEIENIEESLRHRLADEGYALAEVHAQLEQDGEHGVSLLWQVDSGSRFRFGDIEVSGVAEDLERAARRALGPYEGAPYAERRLEDAEYRLQRLQLYQRIQLGVERADSTTLALKCKLSPQSPRRVRLGVGWSTDVGPGALAEWRHTNLLREGRGVAVDASVSRYRTTAGATTWFPGLFHPRFVTSLGLRAEWEDEESYEQFSRTVKLGVDIALEPLVTLQTRAELSDIDLQNVTEAPELDEVVGLVTTVGATFVRDKTNDRFDPTSGTVLTLDGDATPPGLGSNAEFWRVGLSLSGYRRLGTPGTLALRTYLGVGDGFGVSQELIASRRFFGGGSRTHRGYKRHHLGPLDSEGRPLGGELAMSASVELRRPLYKGLYGAAFVDAGQVYARVDSIDDLPIKWAVGPGLYTSTPVGVARLDLGILLAEPPPDNPQVVWHFSIGHPF